MILRFVALVPAVIEGDAESENESESTSRLY